jgi:hypothetical protein
MKLMHFPDQVNSETLNLIILNNNDRMQTENYYLKLNIQINMREA